MPHSDFLMNCLRAVSLVCLSAPIYAANVWFASDMPISQMNEADLAIMSSAIDQTLADVADGEALATLIERDMEPENSWRVELDADDEPRWTKDTELLTMQPARSWWQRVQDVIFRAVPKLPLPSKRERLGIFRDQRAIGLYRNIPWSVQK